MTKLGKKVSSPLKGNTKVNKNMSAVIDNIAVKSDVINNQVQNSILRGKLIRYSQFIPEVQDNLQELKSSNPKYLPLIIKIIDTVIDEHYNYSVDIPFDMLLSKLNKVSYENHEVLDFTEEVLNYTDILTAKFYLASIAGDILCSNNLKQHFKAALPFVKCIVSSISHLEGIDRAAAFMQAIKILINENADHRKIALLPKIKYVIDGISSNNHVIDVTRIIYSKISHDEITARLKTIKKDVKLMEQIGKEFDCTNYLITNSL